MKSLVNPVTFSEVVNPNVHSFVDLSQSPLEDLATSSECFDVGFITRPVISVVWNRILYLGDLAYYSQLRLFGKSDRTGQT